MTPALTLLGKPDCHLCDEMHEIVLRVLAGRVPVIKKDIRQDPELDRRFRFEIPLLLLGDMEIARHRVTEVQLRDRLARLGILQQ